MLGCILSKAEKRKLDISNISEDQLKEQIYHAFQENAHSWRETDAIKEEPDDQYNNFDEYVKYLFTKDGNGLMNIHSFNYLWPRLGLDRDSTFFTVRPTQTEAYIFCSALGWDYDVYGKLRRLLEKEWAESSEAEKKFRKSFKGFTDTERDAVLREYLSPFEFVWNVHRSRQMTWRILFQA